MVKERWKEIEDFPSYEVRDLGSVCNIRSLKIKKTYLDNYGYEKVSLVSLKNEKKTYRKTVHRLVAEAFLGGKHPDLQVNHKNGKKADNRLDNLEWCTGSQNVKHAYDSGLRSPSGGRGDIRTVRVTETGKTYPNLHECAKDIGSDSGNISKCVRGLIPSVKGFHIEYVDTCSSKKKPFLYPYQMDAVKRMKNGCVLNGGVGSGKSRTGLYYYFKEQGGSIDPDYIPMKNPKDLYIVTTAQKRNTLEFEGELAYFLLSPNPEVNYYNNKVIIDSWNNLRKYENVEGAFFLLDEQRLCGSGAWAKSFLKIAKRNDWILLSATAGDTWMDYCTIFIANGFYKNRTEFKREHVVYNSFISKYPKIDHYVGTGKLLRLKKSILIDMDFKRQTIAHHEDIYVKYDIDKYKTAGKLRWDPFKNEPIKDAGGLCYVWRRIVNSDESRQVALLEIFEDHPKLIIFYSFDYELEILRTLFKNTGVKVAEYNGHKHESLPNGPTWVYLVNYAAGNAGWNCITTDTIVFYSQNYSYKVMQQAAGRIDRLNTPYTDLYYYHLKSRSGIDLAISKALSQKRNFNEGRFVNW